MPSLYAEAPTVTEVAASLLRTKVRAGVSDHYLKKLRLACRRIIQASGNARIAEVFPSPVEKSMARLKGRTAQNHIDCLKALFAFAQESGFSSNNPAKVIVMPPDESALEPSRFTRPASDEGRWPARG